MPDPQNNEQSVFFEVTKFGDVCYSAIMIPLTKMRAQMLGFCLVSTVSPSLAWYLVLDNYSSVLIGG